MDTANDQPLRQSLLDEYALALARLDTARDRAARLRGLADQAADQVLADERLVCSLAEVLGISPQATIHELGGGLRGQQLREAAVEVLSKYRRPGEPIHYREWFELLRDERLVVAGRDPLATFLAQVSRSDAVEAVGRRSGQYQLRAVS